MHVYHPKDKLKTISVQQHVTISCWRILLTHTIATLWIDGSNAEAHLSALGQTIFLEALSQAIDSLISSV